MQKEQFENKYHESPQYHVFSSGRFEIIGNHTDHNGGKCVAASCDLAISGFLSKNDDSVIKLCSLGYTDSTIKLDDLSLKDNELGTTIGLVKGVCKYFVDHDYKIGGFSLLSESTIFEGAGVSSSAAFESLIAQILNVLYNNGTISHAELAKAGQYSENNYFGKRSGLLDQSAICFGNISFMDFSGDLPKVKTLDFPFKHLQFVIVNTGGSHADLSDLYSSIPLDMKNAAKKVGVNLLIETDLETIENSKDKLSESEYLRAKHFFGENERVLTLVKAIENKDEKLFLEMIKGSFISSRDNLKNMMVKDYAGSPLEACDYAYKFLGDDGACKINGGGFAGSIIAVVNKDKADEFIKYMAKKYPLKNISKVNINPYPPVVEKI